MLQAEMDRIVDEHFVYEATDDVDGVVATLTDDVAHHVIGSPWGPLTGREAARPFYEQLFGDLKGEGVEPLARSYGDDFLIDDTLWKGHVLDGRAFGFPGQSGYVEFRLLHVFEFRDGLISKEHVWCDTIAIREQLAKQ